MPVHSSRFRMASRYLDFDRAQWAPLRAATPLTLSEADLSELQGINERVSLAEVEADAGVVEEAVAPIPSNPGTPSVRERMSALNLARAALS